MTAGRVIVEALPSGVEPGDAWEVTD